MAGGRDLKGITVSIGGDTTKLQSALAGVNKEVKNTQAQLKDVEKLLKLDPSNTELLSQKQKLLTQAISETKEKLTTLKTAAEQANEQLQKGEITQEQYDALQREIEETEQALRTLESQASSTNATLAKIEEVGGKFEQVGQSITNAGKTLTTHVTAPILAAGTAAVKTAADFDEGMSKVSAIKLSIMYSSYWTFPGGITR
jgi:phage-related minor tail protein